MPLLPKTSHARTVLGALAALIICGVALAACGGDDDDGEEPSQAQGPVAASAPAKNIVAQIPPWFDARKPQAPGTYVGAADNKKHNPYVAVVVQEDDVVVYVCDGKKIGDWFGGEVEDGRFNLESELGTAISGNVAGDKITGTVALPDGAELRYTADKAVKGKTGLGIGPSVNEGADRRWIATRFGLRGIDQEGDTFTDGTSTQAGTVGTQTETPGAKEGPDPKCVNFITAGCAAPCTTLFAEQDAFEREARNRKTTASRLAIIREALRNYDNQINQATAIPPAQPCIA